jgi:hypothetical protein
MRFFLHMKAFPLFLLISGVSLVLVIATLVPWFTGTGRMLAVGWASDLSMISGYVSTFSVIAATIWQYVVSTSLYEKLPPEQPMDLAIFKRHFVISLSASIGTFLYGEAIDSGLLDRTTTMVIMVQLPLAIVTLIFGIKVDLFMAKSLRAVETGREVKWGDYSGYFFSILFYFIGVLWMQPKINQAFSEEGPTEPGGPIDRL